MEIFQFFAPTFVLLLTVIISEVGGYNTDPYNDISNLNGDSSLCRVVRDTRKTVLTSFRNHYTASVSVCDITNHCANVTCTAEFSRGRVNAGLLLNLCEEDPELMYWVDIPGQWDQPWNHTFSSKHSNGEVERKEITGNSNETKPTRWFIEVSFSISPGHNRINRSIKYISALSVLQICQSASTVSEETCTNTTLLNFPRLPQSQICETPVVDLNDDEEEGDHRHEVALLRSDVIGGYPSSTRSSRNAIANPSAWNPEQLHRQAVEKAKMFENGQSLKAAPGDKCDIQEIFNCGPGSACVRIDDGSGLCQCLPGFAFNTTAGECVQRAASPSDDDSSSVDSLDSRSYSSALGATISLLLLIAIAAGIYFGTKYNYINFAQLRHRIPVLRCWPFQRSPPWEDNVTMVNPLGPPDDDDPLLL